MTQLVKTKWWQVELPVDYTCVKTRDDITFNLPGGSKARITSMMKQYDLETDDSVREFFCNLLDAGWTARVVKCGAFDGFCVQDANSSIVEKWSLRHKALLLVVSCEYARLCLETEREAIRAILQRFIPL
jgi:hypothetical protein